jgi:hypothetical protein
MVGPFVSQRQNPTRCAPRVCDSRTPGYALLRWSVLLTIAIMYMSIIWI